MTTLMDGQLDLFALLEPAPTAAAPTVPLTCPGCGQTSQNAYLANLNHWLHPADTRSFGQPVCISMNMRRNHVTYWLRVISGAYESPDKKCCHGATKDHKGRATRDNYLQHLRGDIARAADAWPDMDWLRPLLDEHDVTLDEAGLDDDGWGASCDRKGCDWGTREAGYATRAAAMAVLREHEEEAHS